MTLNERTHALIRTLGYAGGRTFFDKTSVDADFQFNHIIRQAIFGIGVDGVYCLDDGFGQSRLKPIVYVARAENLADAKSIWRDVWSQGVTPFLLIVTPDQVMVCDGFQAPDEKYLRREFDPSGFELVEGLKYFTAARISSSVTWQNFDIRSDANIDHTLIAAIEALHHKAVGAYPHLADRPDLVNALIGKFIYTYVLIDRGILSSDWLLGNLPAGLAGAGKRTIVDLVHGREFLKDPEGWTKQAVFAVFRIVDDAINGSVFQIADEDQDLVPLDLCYLVHRVVRCGEILDAEGAQLSFFDVSFEVLRTETISAIYETFVAIEDGSRKKNDGIYYTPPHLADHVLDRVEELRLIDMKSRVVDAAAGSGIFLVGAYRRLLERHAPSGGWSPDAVADARRLLLDCIFGFEKHPQATNVCRFSLYLTMLDYVGQAPISVLVAASGSDKFLPQLSENIRPLNAFSVDPTEQKFTHVVGNPPWAATGGQKDRLNGERSAESVDRETQLFADSLAPATMPIAHNRLSDLFLWLAKVRLAEKGGVIALILPARSLIGRQSDRFAHALARELTVRWVGNFSHLRRKLFPGSEAPACLVVATNTRPTQADRALVYRPLISSLPAGKRNEVWSLLASQSELDVQRSVDFQRGDNGWFRQAMLGGLDRRMSDALQMWSAERSATFGDFLRNSGLIISKGGSERETGIRRKQEEGVKALTREQLPSVQPGFRGRFAGNVILVPRSMAAAAYFPDPVAYSSSYNAIIPEAQHLAFKERADANIVPLPGDAVNSLLRYLDSGVLRYFASLFGATYLMDKTRFEKNDLLSLPCPYADMDSDAFRNLASVDDVDQTILQRMDAGDEFREAFFEFDTFRKEYANSQIPVDTMKRPADDIKELYRARLADEIAASFDRNRRIDVRVLDVSADQSDVVVDFVSGRLRDVLESLKPAELSGRFLSGSIVSVDRDRGFAAISKPAARFAWTLDQAVADALALRREIRRSA